MNLVATVAVQVCIMFLLIVLGFIIKKCKLITKEGSKQLSDILLILVTPCVVIKAYQVDFEFELASGLLTAFIAATVINAVSILVSKLIFGRSRTPRGQIDQYCAAYSNCGFMAIPLLEAVLGAEGVFYGSAYLAVFNILNWTHGIYIYTQDRKSLSHKKILINPGVIGVVIGLALFFARIRLPGVLYTAVDYMAGLNTPLAMLLLGVFLADVNFSTALKNGRLYLVSFVRLVLVPVIGILLLKLPFVGAAVAVAVLIPAACPSATAAALFAAKYDLDAGYASEIVALNTLMSIVTIPLIVALNQLIPAMIL